MSVSGINKSDRPRYPVVRILRLLLFRLLLAFVLSSILLVLPLRWLPPPISSFMIQSYFMGLGKGPVHYAWVPYDEISPHLALAAVAAEDQRFPEHRGFDLHAIKQALEDNSEGKPLRGASTISQQVAKNLYLWPVRSLFRKGLESWFTVLIEVLWPKRRILEIYLNVVELGEQTFGVEAASRRFFKKPAANLDAKEAALLAAVLPNPHRYRVDAPSVWVRKRQAWILRQMHQLGGPAYLNDL